jgi:hypothetical protein
VSNAQRRREARHRNKAYPGPMTQAKAAQHKADFVRLADLERLKRVTRAYLAAAQDAEAEKESGDAAE